MHNFQRTQIYLEQDQVQQLKVASHKERIPMSALIRQAIDQFLNRKIKAKGWAKDSLLKGVGKLSLKTDTASVDHGRYLYGG